MGPTFFDTPAIHKDDAIDILNCRKAVSNNDEGYFLNIALDVIKNFLLRLYIKTGKCIIEN